MAAGKRKTRSETVSSTSKAKRRKQQPKISLPESIIPKKLEDVIKQASDDVYELTFPLDEVDSLHRLAWGLDKRATSVDVFINWQFGKDRYPGFCVHSSTDIDDRGRLRGRHRFCSTRQSTPNKTICSPRSNILTCVLGGELHGLLSQDAPKLSDIYDQAADVIASDPTSQCLICGKDFAVKLYTPTACLGKCMEALDGWPLRARMSHLLADVTTLDFLLCTIYTAADGQKAHPDAYREESSLLAGCPLKLDQIQPVVDTFPAVSDRLSANDLLRGGRAKHERGRKQIMGWLCSRFRGCMVSLSPGAGLHVPNTGAEDKPGHQFVLLNPRPERLQRFASKVNRLKAKRGSVAFHGTKPPRAFSILTDGLINTARTPYDDTKAGIFCAEEPYTSLWYAGRDPPLRGWSNSIFAGMEWSIIFGLEVAVKLGAGYQIYDALEESLFMVRYVFVYPRLEYACWTTGHKARKSAMEKAYEALDGGAVVPGHIGGTEEDEEDEE